MNAPLSPPNVASPDCALDGASIEPEISAKLMILNYARMRLGVVLTGLVTLIFFGLLAPFFAFEQGLRWGGVLLLTSVGRYFLYWVYCRSDSLLTETRRWAVWSFVGAWAAGASWAFGPVSMMPPAGGNTAMLLVVTLLSVSAVAVTALSAHLASLMVFIATALFPTAAALYFSGETIERSTACIVIAAAIMLMFVGRNAHLAIKSLIRTELLRSRTVEQLKVAHGRAEAASIAKTRFLSNMSHELRTPLNAVIGAAQLLRSTRTPADDGDAHLIDAIQQGGSNLLCLIEGILDLSRIEAGALQVAVQEFNLIETIEGTLATAAVSARIKGLILSCIVEPDLAAWRRGDPALLRQVLLNLLGNAVKFTLHGEVVVRVTRGASPSALCISVRDTGIGIPESALQQVFAPFNQVDVGANRRFGGSGLGLTIARELIEAMGGRIRVHSQLGVGSCFEIDIDLPSAEDPLPKATSLQQQIAFFEPHAPSAEALHAHLTRLGCAAYRCHTQQDLRAWLTHQADNSNKPWLFINCDAPEAEALLEICLAWLAPESVIGMTNSDSHRDAATCRYLHLSRHLVKPILRSALISRLGNQLISGMNSAPLTQPAKQLTVSAVSGSDQHKHVLVVEDDLLNQTIVCRMLTHAGYRVTVAGDGTSALAILASETFDLVLMDWQMPDMDGLDVTRRLRHGAAGRAGEVVPIVALTANAFAEDRAICLTAGMNDYLTKPVVAEMLYTVVERWTTGVAQEAIALPPAPSALPAFDPTVLAALPMVADGSEPDYVEKVLDLYLNGTPRALATIDDAASQGDARTLLFWAHKLKSSSASVGALALAKTAERQESQLRAGHLPEPEWPRHLREQYSQFECALAHHRQVKGRVACAST
jgi:signal transduction histidine kinase/CheY-like chemotaxis protein/HPt (histidine-containing phosphotransfer) domain-containing protein